MYLEVFPFLPVMMRNVCFLSYRTILNNLIATSPVSDWTSWGKAWRAHYDTTEPKERETNADGRPNIPPPRSSDEDWKKFGDDITAWYKARGGKNISISFV
jgi:hypothetical protein